MNDPKNERPMGTAMRDASTATGRPPACRCRPAIDLMEATDQWLLNEVGVMVRWSVARKDGFGDILDMLNFAELQLADSWRELSRLQAEWKDFLSRRGIQRKRKADV